MAKDQGIVQSAMRRRTALASAKNAGGGVDAPAKKRIGPVQFLREVRAEGRKVTWTSWKETWITSVMVGIMVILTALFFFGLDGFFNFGMVSILKLVDAG
jgi:preprotein translocase subunit SecE